MNKSCTCYHCKNYDKYKWAVIKECICGCHESDGMVGHDGLCCFVPNGLVKNNLYKNLGSAKYYKKKLDKWEKENEW